MDYSKLKGRIVEKCGSTREFAKTMGLTRQSIYNKLSGMTNWDQEDILKVCNILDIPTSEIPNYFFKMS